MPALARGRLRRIAGALCGSWRRIFTTLAVAFNLILIVGLCALAFVPRKSLFQIDAYTDALSFMTVGDRRWGEATLQGEGGGLTVCARGSVQVPDGTLVEARRDDMGVSVFATRSKGQTPLVVRCSGGTDERLAYVELRFEAQPLTAPPTQPPAEAKAIGAGPNALPAVPQNEGALQISGQRLRVGSGADPDSPVMEVALLRHGGIRAETTSWPIASSSVVTTRELQTGDIVSFDPPVAARRASAARGRKPATFSGLILLSDASLRLVARTEAGAAYVTSPGALGGRPAIVAPTPLQRLQAQAEWGVFVVIGAMLLNIIGALRNHLGEHEALFRWTETRPLADKLEQT